jgi:peptide methionine sulfoxide reductase MsrA
VNDEQKRVAEDAIADVNASGLWPGKVVTEVVPAGPLWEAESEHQDYLQHFPDGYSKLHEMGMTEMIEWFSRNPPKAAGMG